MSSGTDGDIVVSDAHPFSVGEYRARLDRVRQEMASADVDVLLVMSPEDIFYLTGFRSMGFLAWQALVVTPVDDPVMISRRLEEIMFRDNSWSTGYCAYSDEDDPVRCAAGLLAEVGAAQDRIGIPLAGRSLTVDHVERLRKLLPGANWVDTTHLVAGVRAVKTPAELEVMRSVGPLTAAGMRAGADAAAEGGTENVIAAAFLEKVIRMGSHDPAAGPYVGAGPRSAFGHSSWENRRLRHGDLVFLEGSACLHRYHVALMRTISIGEPDAEALALEEASRAGAAAAVAAVRPGATAGDVDAACRDAVHELGMSEFFRHRTGYSVGIGFTEWIDGFSLKPGAGTILRPNMVLHLVPFLSTGARAVALSETVAVTEHGAEMLTDLEPEVLVR
jgi:Xaa-Pro aminopeptidase